MSRLLWMLPTWYHELILKLTGWRLVKVTDDNGWYTTYVWTDCYPLCPRKDG